MRVVTAVCLLAGAAVATAGMASVAAAGRPSAAPEVAQVCPGPVGPGIARCSAIQLLNPALNWHGVHVLAKGSGHGHGGGGGGGGTPTTPPGYQPVDLQNAYGLSSISWSSGTGETVAIVDAYNDPYAASDLAAYRSQWNLPAICVTGGSGSCSGPSFTQVNQNGQPGPYPRANTSWSEEISLDLDMVSAICPYCNILLVEAKSASFSNLIAAEQTALAAQPAAVSNSYGGSEFSGETAYNGYYSSSTSAITVSAGDGGYGVEYPAAAPSVVAVGGTTLSSASSTSAGSQTVWSGTGSGCSAYEQNPGWQPVTTLCSGRTVADVSADANPATGVAVYDTYGESGWLVFGGTSVASPIVASVFALAGYHSSSSAAAQGLYTNETSLTKITSGSNSSGCSDYLCNAADSLGSTNSVTATEYPDNGYNGPTGNGTPNGLNGLGAF